MFKKSYSSAKADWMLHNDTSQERQSRLKADKSEVPTNTTNIDLLV